MGVTFPVSAMGMWPSSGAACCPSPHYVELQIGQTNYGQPLTAALPQLGALLLFLLPLLLVVHRYRTPSGRPCPMRSPGHDGILGSGAP